MKDPKVDHDADRIRAALARVTPGDPGVSARAANVAARARRQQARRRTAGMVAVAAAAAVLVLAPSLMTKIRTENTGPDVTAGAPPPTGEQDVDPFTTTACPANPVDLGTASADQLTTDEILADATSIRLCSAVVGGGGRDLSGGAAPVPLWLPPADALELSLDDFLTLTAGLPEADQARCAAIRPVPDPYAYVVGYPSGTTQTVAVSNICTDVTVAGRRVAAPAVLQSFQQALSSQRGQMQPSKVDTPGVECPGVDAGEYPGVPTTRGAGLDATTRFTRLVTCGKAGASEADGDALGLLNDAWQTSIRDLSTRQPRHVNRCPTIGLIEPPSYGVTTWGDVVVFAFRGCGNYLVHGYEDPSVPEATRPPAVVQFLPSDELSRRLGLPTAR